MEISDFGIGNLENGLTFLDLGYYGRDSGNIQRFSEALPTGLCWTCEKHGGY